MQNTFCVFGDQLGSLVLKNSNGGICQTLELFSNVDMNHIELIRCTLDVLTITITKYF